MLSYQIELAPSAFPNVSFAAAVLIRLAYVAVRDSMSTSTSAVMPLRSATLVRGKGTHKVFASSCRQKMQGV